MADEFRFTLVNTPAGKASLLGKIGKDRILVSQNAQHQVEYQDKCRREGKKFKLGLRLPCAMWIFGICWQHQTIFAIGRECSKCTSAQGINIPV